MKPRPELTVTMLKPKIDDNSIIVHGETIDLGQALNALKTNKKGGNINNPVLYIGRAGGRLIARLVSPTPHREKSLYPLLEVENGKAIPKEEFKRMTREAIEALGDLNLIL